MNTAYFNVSNDPASGQNSEQVFISIFGQSTGATGAPAAGTFCYLDISTGNLVPFTTYTSGVTSQQLSAISGPIAIPAMKSARMYFAIGSDFDSKSFSVSSGPSMSQINDGGADVLFDFVEFDTSTAGSYNINSTNVDMYAISYTMSLTDQSGNTVTRGLTGKRMELLDDLRSIPSGDTTGWYGQLLVKNKVGDILRFMAPAQPAYADFASDSGYHLARTNYFSNYITNEVFRPNRTFSFYDKLYPGASNLCTASVSADGQTMTIVHQEGSQSETITLKLPVNAMTSDEIAANWNNVSGDNASIDWGFVFLGNSLVPSLPRGWGAVDPVLGGPDAAVMALMISICRGVAHLDNGCVDWVDSANYYLSEMTEYYAQTIHRYALDGFAYALAYDDIYGKNSSVFFNSGTTVNFDLNSLTPVNGDAS